MNEGATVAQAKATAEAHAGTCDVTAPVLMVKDVVKAFGAKRAVDGVSLEGGQVTFTLPPCSAAEITLAE